MSRRLLYILVCTATILAAAVSPGRAQRYTIRDLGTLGGTQSWAKGMNDYGHVVGYSQRGDGVERPFLFTNGLMRDLGALPQHERGQAYDINNRGQVVGRSYSNGAYHAFVWQTGTMTRLQTTANSNSSANAINNSGDIAGYAKCAGLAPWFYACFWTGKSNTYVNLSNYDDTYERRDYISSSWGINDRTQVVGLTHMWLGIGFPSGGNRPFVWEDLNRNGQDDDGEMSILGTLGGDEGIASAINAFGQVIGHAGVTTDVSHAFIVIRTNGNWKTPSFERHTTNYLMYDMGTLGDADYAEPLAINDAGFVVGSSEYEQGNANRRAFISYGEELIDLNSLVDTNTGWTLTYATDVNNSGQICGYGQLSNVTRAFLLTPIGFTVTITRIEHDADDGFIEDFLVAWRGEGSNLLYTLETADSPTASTWQAVTPTNTWPDPRAYWTHGLTGLTSRMHYRVRATQSLP